MCLAHRWIKKDDKLSKDSLGSHVFIPYRDLSGKVNLFNPYSVMIAVCVLTAQDAT